jgi:hypothetical protein
MVMGDLVLTEDQVNPVMSVALESGLEVTALHNHFFGDSPKVMFMHIGGMGDQGQLGTAVGKVFAKIQSTGPGGASRGASGQSAFPTAEIDPARSKLDPARIDAVLGKSGELTSGVTSSPSGGRPACTALRSATPWASTLGPPSPAATSRRWSTATSP